MTKLRNRNKTKRRHRTTKRRSHSHRTRSQKGGDIWYTISLGNFGKPSVPEPVATGLSEPPSLWSKMTNYFSGPTDSENVEITDSIKNTFESTINAADAKVGDVAKNMTEGAIELAEEAKNEANKIVEETTGYVRSEENNAYTPSPIPVTGGKSRKYKNRKGTKNDVTPD